MGIFNYDSPLVRVLNRITDLVMLNIVFLLCCIPVITAGAALSALHAVSMQMVCDEEGKILPAFFRFFKRDFKQATVVWVLLLAAVVLLFADLVIFTRHGGGLFLVQEHTTSFVMTNDASGSVSRVQFSGVFRILTVIALTALFVIWIVSQYVFPLTARYDNGVLATFKNALFTSVLAFPRTVAMLFIDAFVFFWIVSPFAFYVLPVLLLIGVSGPVFLKTLLYRPVLERLEEKNIR